MSAEEVISIAGHKTEKAFMKYIRVTKPDAAKRLNQHMNYCGAAPLLSQNLKKFLSASNSLGNCSRTSLLLQLTHDETKLAE